MPDGVTRHLLLNSLLQQHLLQKKKKNRKTWACFNKKKLSIFYTIFHIQVPDKCSALSSSHAVISHKFKLQVENSDEILFTILQPVVQCLNPFGQIWPLGIHYLCLGGLGHYVQGFGPSPFPHTFLLTTLSLQTPTRSLLFIHEFSVFFLSCSTCQSLTNKQKICIDSSWR